MSSAAFESAEASRLPQWVEVLLSALPLAYAILMAVVQLATFLLPSWSRSRVFIREEEREDDDPKQKTRISKATILLIALSAIGFADQLISSVLVLTLLPTISWSLSLLVVVLRRPRTAPFSLLGLHTLLFVSGLVWSTCYHDANTPIVRIVLDPLSTVVSLLAVLVSINMPLRDPSLSRVEISKAFTTPTSQLRSPEDNLTLWQWMTVSWMSPLIHIGSKRQIQDEDVWFLGYEFQHTHLHNAFRELKGTVVRRLIRANWIDLVLLSALAILELVANYSSPILLQQLLLAMEGIRHDVRPAVTFAVLTLVVRVVAAQTGVFSLWFGRRCYERSRGEMITMLYEKTLNRKIVGSVQEKEEVKVIEDSDDAAEGDSLLNGHQKVSPGLQSRLTETAVKIWRFFPTMFRRKAEVPREKKPTSMGKLLNLMKADVYEVAQRFWEFQNLITKPLGVILSLVLIWRLIGWPSLLGVAIIIVAQGINTLLAREMLKWEMRRRKATDDKLQQTSQFIEAIRHLRWYGWHPTWLKKIMEARQKELNLRIVIYMWRMAVTFVNTLAGGLLPVAAFYGYTFLAGQQLHVDVAFPALQLFGMLQSDLREIPNLITVLINAYVAVGRIEDFMSEPDRDINTEDQHASGDDELSLDHASFAWPGFQKNVLKDITLSFPVGLTVVYGEVASGKTALLQALLGELDLHNGRFFTSGEAIGYCAQTPWLQSMSIRENILFSSPYEDSRYKATLDACALTADLANFKHGDLSNIGENGIGLSGGQKARVALARAVYSRAKLLFLDDPLSALDQQTAESVVSKCLVGDLMRGRTVVLVTHRVDLCLGRAQQWVELSLGSARICEADETGPSALARSTSNATQNEDQVHPDAAQESAAVPDKFLEDEQRAHGGVRFAVYWAYVKAGKYRWWVAMIITAALFRFIVIFQSWFLKSWSEAYGEDKKQLFLVQGLDELHMASNPLSGFFDRFPDPGVNVQPWLIAFLITIIAYSVATLITQVFMLVVTYTAGRRMFKDIMEKVSNATFRFYDVTPVGRLMNRVTSDIGTIDGAITGQLHNFMWQSLSWVSSIVVIAAVTPTFLVFAFVLTIAFVVIFLRFLPTSQSLRRLEMVSLSPLMSNFGALVEGLTTVRAFCAQSRFQARVIDVTDTFQKMDHFYWSLQAWLMYRFDTLSAISTFILTLLAIYTGISPGLTAFVLVAAGKLVSSTHTLCKQYGQLQMDFVSVERVVELIEVEQEAPGSISPPAWWPSCDSDIVFEDVTIRYAANLDPALRGVSFTLKGGSNNAVIGRTGSGKSTLALALLGTITPESGRILINGIDIANVDKQALRTRVSFLAQDPVLFPGSMRQNLDPTGEHSDEECESILSRVCGRFGWTLDMQIDTGGRNLSQGQRQLVGLSRAILRRSAVVIMDEATASIDKESAWEIQRVLREEMRDSTVITIAHRPSAVRDATYCVVLGHGQVIDEGEPGDVVARQGSAEADGPDTI